MNKDTMQGDWEQFKGKIKQEWASVGDKDLAGLAEGKEEEVAGRIQELTGKSEDEVKRKLKEFKESCGCSSSGSSNKAA